MIFRDRAKIQSPRVLTGRLSKGAKESARICAYFASPPPRPPKQPAHVHYSDAEVESALYELFHGKCAYCESRYASTQPMDVEHFRPKGRISDDGTHPGYYWLGATWENLLPSCIDCNRERWQDIVQPAGASVAARAGKACAFPLFNEAKRARGPADSIADEQAVLLNPCQDDPKGYLEFTLQGVVRASGAAPSPGWKRADRSIAIYGLNRAGLVVARLEVVRLLQARMLTIGRLVQVLDHCGDGKKKLATTIQDLLAHELAELNAFTHPDRPYSEMCRQVVADFMKTFAPPP